MLVPFRSFSEIAEHGLWKQYCNRFPALPPNLTTPLNCICNRKRGGESSLRIRAAIVSAEIWAEVPELARGFVLSEQ